MADVPLNNSPGDEARDASFAERLFREWRNSQRPEQVMCCATPDEICIACNGELNRRSNSCDATFEWSFLVCGNGRQLKHIALTTQQTGNFVIRSVTKSNKEIGNKSDREWSCTEDESTPAQESKPEDTEAPYIVNVAFSGQKYGTYRENLVFAFDEKPAILRRLCVDCAPDEDLQRIETATRYQLSQTAYRWADYTLLQLRDAKEEGLSKIYPFPDKENFFLTQETLNDPCLTKENYRGRLHELIATEELSRHEQIARYNATATVRVLSHYIVESAGDCATHAKYAYPGELFAQLPLTRHIVMDTRCGRLFLRSCNAVLIKSLRTESPSTPIVYEAHIENKCMESVYLRLPKHFVDALSLTPDMDLKVQVQFILTRMAFCEWHRAVDCLPDVGLVLLDDEKTQVRNDFTEAFADNIERLFSNHADKMMHVILNAEQLRAVITITIPITIRLPPVLVLGPFGTGKTFAIAQALRLLLLQDTKHKILLCTHSNSAADLYVCEYFNFWYKVEGRARFKPTRIYYKGRAKSTVSAIAQEYTLMDENGRFRDPTEDDLKESGLIITTLATASSLMGLNLLLTHIIIDEAAQALECEILIPLSLATKETRLVLAGDQMQLAPEIYSDLANECSLGISMLERIYQLYPPSHPCRVHLCQSFRAHPDIIRFTSEMFYEGLVQPSDKRMFKHPILKPLTFFAVNGEETQGTHSTGYVHASEACELANRVLELKNTWPVQCWGPYVEGSIGVLSYYRDQVQRIRTELRKRGLHDVSVEQVLNVQGKEFTAVFISVVRTRTGCGQFHESNLKDYGFLSNPRLLNTAITRAKCLVAVVGDPIGVQTIGSCRKMWQRYVQCASLYGITHEALNYHLSSIPDPPAPTPLNPLAREFVPRQPAVVEYISTPISFPVIPFYVNETPSRNPGLNALSVRNSGAKTVHWNRA